MLSRMNDRITLLVASDAAAMLLSLFVAFLLGHKKEFTFLFATQYDMGIITLVVASFAFLIICDAYTVTRRPNFFMRQSMNIGLALFFSAVSTTFTFFFFRDAVPRAVFIIFYVCSFALIVFLRYCVSNKALNTAIRVLIVGGGERCAEVARLIR